MPDGMPPMLSPEERAELDRVLEDPMFQRYADELMDIEFINEGLSDCSADIEVDGQQLAQIRAALHSTTIALLEPEDGRQEYRIMRERLADDWQQIVLEAALEKRQPGLAAKAG